MVVTGTIGQILTLGLFMVRVYYSHEFLDLRIIRLGDVQL